MAASVVEDLAVAVVSAEASVVVAVVLVAVAPRGAGKYL
jgi:hypothetical protein